MIPGFRPRTTTRSPIVPDASQMLLGANLMGAHVVESSYANVLDRVIEKAVIKGDISAEQLDTGVVGAFAQPDGCLFVCLCCTDGSRKVYGTSIPAYFWWPK